MAQIYTGGKALQFLSVPVFTIFKNLTIIAIAYGEVLLSGGGRVLPPVLFSFGLMVFSSVVAAWADLRAATTAGAAEDTHPAGQDEALRTLNAGYGEPNRSIPSRDTWCMTPITFFFLLLFPSFLFLS